MGWSNSWSPLSTIENKDREKKVVIIASQKKEKRGSSGYLLCLGLFDIDILDFFRRERRYSAMEPVFCQRGRRKYRSCFREKMHWENIDVGIWTTTCQSRWWSGRIVKI